MKKFILTILSVFTLIGVFSFPTGAVELSNGVYNENIEVKASPVQNYTFSHSHNFDTSKSKSVTIQIVVKIASVAGTYGATYVEGAGNCKIASVKGGKARIISEGQKDNADGTLDVVIGFGFTPENEKEKKYNITFTIKDNYVSNVTVI